MLRRIEIEPDDVSRLALEVWIVGGHVAFEPMGFEAGLLPNLVNHRLADAEFSGELAAGPMGRAVAGLAARRRQDPGAQLGREFRRALAGPMRFEPVETLFQEALFPASDRRSGRVELGLDRVVGQSVGE